MESALDQRQGCIRFLREQQATWQHRMDNLQDLRRQAHVGSPLSTALTQEVAMMRGLLLTLKRRVETWQTAYADLVEEQRRSAEEQQGKQGDVDMWACLDEMLADMSPLH